MIQLKLAQLTQSRVGDTYPALEPIPAMQRRRLSTLAKLALNSAIECLAGQQVDYIVWASQYGDEAKTYQILEDVLQDYTPSPTQFSTSVHNAIAGLYSILCQDATPSTSLCATWTEALVEAYAYLKTQPEATQALVVFYDEPLPKIYQEYHDFQGFAQAAIVSLSDINLVISPKHMLAVEYKYLDALSFQSFWQDEAVKQLNMWEKF